VTGLSPLNLSKRVQRILEVNGIADVTALLKLNERELVSLPGFGPQCLTEVRNALVTVDLGELAVDPYARYVCARHGEPAWDVSLANLFLCDDCADKWQEEAFADQDPAYVGAPLKGFCLNCNLERSDVRLRQWFLCSVCERVARSIGRSVVAERFVTDEWNRLVVPVAPNLQLRNTDEPTLHRWERGAENSRQAEADFLVNDEKQNVDVFGFELKTGKSYISGVAQVGASMTQFQLDTSDCDGIASVMEREGVPIYLLHVQVIDRAHPPTLEYKALGAWWTDPFRMNEHFRDIQRRSRETRNAAYFNKAMFEAFTSFADHIASGEYRQLAKRLAREGIPDLYSS
jgi:hypothetical protein